MGGIRPQEWLDAIRRLDEASALGTVVSLDGSVYERSGAPLLLRGPQDAGVIEIDVAEDDPLLSEGVGGAGRLQVHVEPVGERLRADLAALKDRLLAGEGVTLCLDLSTGVRQLLPDDPLKNADLSAELDEDREGRRLIVPIRPMGKALVFGAGLDAASLCAHLRDVGFLVWPADPRKQGWEQVRAAARPDEDTVVVVMTHSYALDLETLQGALASPACYVGLPGPAKRTQRLLAELAVLGVRPRPGVLRSPAGLDLGAETPREVALSIAAEILSFRADARRARRPQPLPRHAKVPGLVLAAGRGRRFTGGNKLAAALDGRPVLRHVVENALASRLDPVIVVLGCQAEDGLRALAGLTDPRLRVVFNPLWEGGKASSIEVGLREVPFLAPGVVSLLGDMPRVKPWLIDRVIEEFELSGRLTFPVFEGRKGYPTAFPRALFEEIRHLTGDDTAMAAVREHWNEAVKIQLQDGSTQADVDTPADLDLLRELR